MYRKRTNNVVLNKPFQLPVLNRPASKDSKETDSAVKPAATEENAAEPVSKKIKVEKTDVYAKPAITAVKKAALTPGQNFRSAIRKPHNSPLVTARASIPTEKKTPSSNEPDIYFEALYRKCSNKKHKSWDGDGTIIISTTTKQATLENGEGKSITKGRLNSSTFEEGEIVKMGFYEVELGPSIDRAIYLSGTAFLKNGSDECPMPAPVKNMTVYQVPVASGSTATISGALRRTTKVIKPRHDPNAEGAIVLTRPKTKKEIVDVVIDPLISRHLRPHQKEGVKFLYECVMGMRDYQGKGAILADEMGLGKTLMTITLIWTLLKQTPYVNESPVIKRALIVCPVTLIANWKKEFKKWLGNERIGVFTLANNKSNLNAFVAGRCYQVMIVGYEKVRSISAELKKASIDIIVCDEGHRLKTAANKSAQAILSLNAEKRIILSGTPIQNDLGEFFTMINFLNPGILGTYTTFKREFELPIIKSRQPEAMKKDIEKGKLRSEELSKLTRLFTLRRTAATLDKYLPPKTDTVLFCNPLPQQIKLYKDLLESNMIRSCLGSSDTAEHLKAITILKKLCNSPALLRDAEFDSSKLQIPATLTMGSGKMRVLEDFLFKIFEDTDEKVVIVSGFTKTLDIIEDKLNDLGLPLFRLDGSTATHKRQTLVDTFNNCHKSKGFAFLLSAKSGGTGLNLIGASRLFLFDTDWNPSVDLQAMARVHRDGQKRPVHIYRLLTTGTMDEKIYQRQITKQGLADTFMDGGAASNSVEARPVSSGAKKLLSVTRDLKPAGGSSSNTFSMAELQDLFSINTETKSNTHDLLGCSCLETNSSQMTTVCNDTPASRSGSVATENAEIIEVSEEEDDDDNTEGLGGWVTARNVAEGNVPIPKRLQNKHRMNGLYEYKHIDPATIRVSGNNSDQEAEEEEEEAEDSVCTGDVILDQLIQKGSPISFIFTRSTLEPLTGPTTDYTS